MKIQDALREISPQRDADGILEILLAPTGISSAGFPYIDQQSYEKFRDTQPHLFMSGMRLLETIDHLCDIGKDSSAGPDRDSFFQAADVIRRVILTSVITAPSDLWLLHHVLRAFSVLGLSEILAGGEGLDMEEIKNKYSLDPGAIKIDIQFLCSRGLLRRQDGRFFTTEQALHGNVFITPGIQYAADTSGAIAEAMQHRHAELWQRIFSGETLADNQRAALSSLFTEETGFRRKSAPDPQETGWVPSWLTIELGYRLLPVVLGLRASGITRKLQVGNYFWPECEKVVGSDLSQGIRELMVLCGAVVLDTSTSNTYGTVTRMGERMFQRGPGPFGIIEAYHAYVVQLPKILTVGKKFLHVSRGSNLVASQIANRVSFRHANDALDQFCHDTGFEFDVFIEHALGHGEATRQRYRRWQETDTSIPLRFVGADLEDEAIQAAIAEHKQGKLPQNMLFVSNADIGKPEVLLVAMDQADIDTNGAVMVVGNGFHEIRKQTASSMTDVFRKYHDAGILLIFTEESGLLAEDVVQTAWNTYHAGFRYVHERSGQVLRPDRDPGEKVTKQPARASWEYCATKAGYILADDYCFRGRTIFPYRPANGRNPAISVNHFCVPGPLAKYLGLSY
tara:strand:+ start:43 stop:1911 length:1869 start_codon:yes stop_codon:yes gene_type:complete